MKNTFQTIPLTLNDTFMGYAKPSISPQGFRTALRDYSENSIIEELAANSYDAYASTFLMLLDDQTHKLYIYDDGSGFNEKAMNESMTLGGGNKLYAPEGERLYLGSYGYGLKSVINIADGLEIITCSDEDDKKYVLKANLLDFNKNMDEKAKGYKWDMFDLPNIKSKGTVLTISLRNAITKTKLEEFAKGLGNLPTQNGSFNCYYGFYRPCKQNLLPFVNDFIGLKDIAAELLEKEKIKLASNLIDSELADCEEEIIHDKEEGVTAKIYFAGMQGGKPKFLKSALRGIFIRVHGRLLRRNFSTDQYIGGISKYIQFKSGTRVEMSVDWLRAEMNLSREGITFSNSKLENDFKKSLSRVISKFLKPKLSSLEKSKLKIGHEKLKGRLELAKKRISKNNKEVIKGIQGGFGFKPDSDAELAMLIAQDFIMNKINPNYKLIDYNDKLPFDCMIYDQSRSDFIYTELEPTLMEFLEHKNTEDVQLIIIWSLGKWRLSATRKKGKGGYFELIHSKNLPKGSYRLNEFASSESIKPRKYYEVIVLDEIL